MLTRAQWQARKRVIVDGYATPSDGRGALQFLSVIVPIGALWAVIEWASDDTAWLIPAAVLCLSLFLLRGFVLMHDCGHDSLFRSRPLNRVAGFLLGVLSGMPQPVWAENHRYHHTTNGNWAKYRGPLDVACVSDYLAMDERGRRRYRVTRDILMAPIAGCLYFLVNPRVTWLRATFQLLRRRLARADRRPSLDEALRRTCASAAHYRHMTWNNLFLLAAWSAMAWAVGPWLFLACWVVSGSLAGGYGIVLFTVQHNFEHAYASADAGWDRDEAAILGTSFLVLPRWLNWITADAAYHHVHHLCASVPNYRLAACHGEHAPLFASVKRVGLFEIPAALKYVLWDPVERRLVSIDEVMQQQAACAVAAAQPQHA
jgi:omega-6 fatty acid desaturase (delta-12 desaturase)